MFKVQVRKQFRHPDHRLHVAERGGENERIIPRGEFANDAFGSGGLGDAFDVRGRDLRAEGLLERELAEMVLIRPAAVRYRPDVHERDFERCRARERHRGQSGETERRQPRTESV